MFVGNECFVTESYQQDRFKLFLEKQLSQRKGSKLDRAFIEYSISAMLECQDRNSIPEDVERMQKHLYSMDIRYPWECI